MDDLQHAVQHAIELSRLTRHTSAGAAARIAAALRSLPAEYGHAFAIREARLALWFLHRSGAHTRRFEELAQRLLAEKQHWLEAGGESSIALEAAQRECESTLDRFDPTDEACDARAWLPLIAASSAALPSSDQATLIACWGSAWTRELYLSKRCEMSALVAPTYKQALARLRVFLRDFSPSRLHLDRSSCHETRVGEKLLGLARRSEHAFQSVVTKTPRGPTLSILDELDAFPLALPSLTHSK